MFHKFISVENLTWNSVKGNIFQTKSEAYIFFLWKSFNNALIIRRVSNKTFKKSGENQQFTGQSLEIP